MKFLSVVHLVDTEGPLFEPLNITFKRINELFNLKIKPSKKNLQKIINKTNIHLYFLGPFFSSVHTRKCKIIVR